MRGAAQSAKDSGHRGDAADELAAMKQVLGMSLSAVLGTALAKYPDDHEIPTKNVR
jgi:hypothetical protein